MDAGMTGGGAQGAEKGTMTLMIGGDPEVFKRTAAILAPVAKKLIYLGESGIGHIISRTWDGRSRVYNLNKDVGMAIALADKLGATVNIGRKTYAYIQEAVRQGRSEDDFTRLYPDLEKLDRKRKAKAKK